MPSKVIWCPDRAALVSSYRRLNSLAGMTWGSHIEFNQDPGPTADERMRSGTRCFEANEHAVGIAARDIPSEWIEHGTAFRLSESVLEPSQGMDPTSFLFRTLW